VSESNGRCAGEVVWFSGPKGYGFLKCADGKEVFCHYSAIEMDGYKTLSQGDKVSFEVIQGEKGKQAANVKRVGGNK